MFTKKERFTVTQSKANLCFSFWIPYIILIFLFLALLYFNSFSFVRECFVLAMLFLPLFFKNKLQNKKFKLRFLFWIFLIIILLTGFILTKPAFQNRTIETSGKKVSTNAVQTQYGAVSGVYNSDKSVEVFAGIPYAAPPIGNLRWKAPQEPAKWDGVRKTDHFSDCPIQKRIPTICSKLVDLQLGTTEISKACISDTEKISEDCLYLNIWTPSNATLKKRPVIVYIYGGSFISGSGSIALYNGENMAKKGAVFVTINYRTGIFGFLSTPELTVESGYGASGNYGILDQIAALKWVKNNIAAFGGDPENVTVAGESAGSMSVNMLQASPLAKDLFQRVIGESGANFGSRGIKGEPMQTLASAEHSGTEFAKTLKKSSLQDLRNMSASDLLKASKNYNPRPMVDGYVLPDTIYNIFASGKENDVPALIGYNATESTIFLSLPFPFSLLPKYSTLSTSEFTEAVKETYGSYSDDFLNIFPANTKNQAIASELSSGTLQWFGWHMITWAKLQSQMGESDVYAYYFTHVQPGTSRLRELGAFHGSEIAYAYDNLGKNDLSYDNDDYKLSEIMSTYWYNFAATGNPNGTGLPIWEAYDTNKDQILQLDDDISMIETPNKEELDFFDRYEASLRTN